MNLNPSVAYFGIFHPIADLLSKKNMMHFQSIIKQMNSSTKTLAAKLGWSS